MSLMLNRYGDGQFRCWQFISSFHRFVFQKHFGRMFLSLMQTFAMMAGEINYQDNFMKPYMARHLPFPVLTYFIFIWFVLLVPILLMNLLVSFTTNSSSTPLISDGSSS